MSKDKERLKKYSRAMSRSMKFYALMDSLICGSKEWEEANKKYLAAEQEMASIYDDDH